MGDICDGYDGDSHMVYERLSATTFWLCRSCLARLDLDVRINGCVNGSEVSPHLLDPRRYGRP